MIRRLFMRPLARFHDVLLSIYLYNERQGFIYLERLARAFEVKYPAEAAMLEAIRKHARDERKHHDMFQHWELDPTEIVADELSHFEPYDEWLRRQGEARPRLREVLADLWAHLGLVYFRTPLLFLNPALTRADWIP